MIEVWAIRTNSPAAAALVNRLHAEGRHARENNSAWWDPKQIDREAVHVYHDNAVPAIPDVYEAHGIPCELIPGLEPETQPTRPHKDRSQTGGYRVGENGTWFTLYGPDGEKIGKSQRSEAEAWALMPEDED